MGGILCVCDNETTPDEDKREGQYYREDNAKTTEGVEGTTGLKRGLKPSTADGLSHKSPRKSIKKGTPRNSVGSIEEVNGEIDPEAKHMRSGSLGARKLELLAVNEVDDSKSEVNTSSKKSSFINPDEPLAMAVRPKPRDTSPEKEVAVLGAALAGELSDSDSDQSMGSSGYEEPQGLFSDFVLQDGELTSE